MIINHLRLPLNGRYAWSGTMTTFWITLSLRVLRCWRWVANKSEPNSSPTHHLYQSCKESPLSIAIPECLHCPAASCATDWQLVAILQAWWRCRCSIDSPGSLARLVHMCEDIASCSGRTRRGCRLGRRHCWWCSGCFERSLGCCCWQLQWPLPYHQRLHIGCMLGNVDVGSWWASVPIERIGASYWQPPQSRPIARSVEDTVSRSSHMVSRSVWATALVSLGNGARPINAGIPTMLVENAEAERNPCDSRTADVELQSIILAWCRILGVPSLDVQERFNSQRRLGKGLWHLPHLSGWPGKELHFLHEVFLVAPPDFGEAVSASQPMWSIYWCFAV